MEETAVSCLMELSLGCADRSFTKFWVIAFVWAPRAYVWSAYIMLSARYWFRLYQSSQNNLLRSAPMYQDRSVNYLHQPTTIHRSCNFNWNGTFHIIFMCASFSQFNFRCVPFNVFRMGAIKMANFTFPAQNVPIQQKRRRYGVFLNASIRIALRRYTNTTSAQVSTNKYVHCILLLLLSLYKIYTYSCGTCS